MMVVGKEVNRKKNVLDLSFTGITQSFLCKQFNGSLIVFVSLYIVAIPHTCIFVFIQFSPVHPLVSIIQLAYGFCLFGLSYYTDRSGVGNTVPLNGINNNNKERIINC